MTIIGLVAAGLGVSILPASFQRVQLSGNALAADRRTGCGIGDVAGVV